MSSTDRKKALILEAAFECFSSYGYTKCCFRDVARKAGISRASLYTYFKNKRDLFITMNHAINAEHFRKSMALRASTLTDREKVMGIIDEWTIKPYIDIQRTPQANSWLDELVSISRETEKSYQDLFISSLEPIIGEERAEVIVYSLRGLMNDRPAADLLTKRIRILVEAMV
ncbi:MAG: TetR/AcrR family transcriptional regulator [Dehalococcoidales bacterium]|nr:TetR/AcrR family transcriptional regulator [Dehalococcoidales bacterium]